MKAKNDNVKRMQAWLGVMFLCIGMFGMTRTAHAQPCIDEDSLTAGFDCVINGIMPASGVRGDITTNPALVVALIINAVLAIAAVLGIGAIIAGGVMYITSIGEEEKAKRAKTIIIFAVIGLIIILISAVVTNAIINIFT